MAETLTIRTASSTEVIKVAIEGPQGPAGQGVPVGGSTGQVLRKASGTDYDTEWAAAGSGSGSVTSVALASTDLTISGSPITESGTLTANIAANAVTLEKLQTISSEHLLGRHGSGNGGVQQIGLGTGLAISGSNVGVSFGSSAGTACQGNDARLSDSRTPTAHGSSHHTGGTDAIAPNQISAAWQEVVSSQIIGGNVLLSAGRNRRIVINSYASANIDLPASGNQAGDRITFVAGVIISAPTIRIPFPVDTWTASKTLTATGQSYTYVSDGSQYGWSLVPVDTHTHAASDITSGTLGIARIPTGTSSSTVCIGNDSRLSDSRTPSSHSSSHASAGSDPLAPSDIGAQSIFVTEALGTVTANVTLTAARAKIYTLQTTTSGLRILLPASDVLAGDIVQIRFTSSTGQSITPVRGTMSGFFTEDIGPVGGPVTFIAASASGTSWTIAPVDRHVHGNIGDQGNIGTTSGLPIKTATSGVLVAGAFGTGAGEFAEGNHTHAQLHDRSHAITSTSDHTAGNHKVFYSDGSGQVQELALGSSGTVLTSNGATSAPSFAAAAGGGVTGAAASASDVLGVSGANITGVDANADRIVYWNNTANKLAYGTPADAGAAAASHTHAASDVTSGTFDNARINFAAPAAIGNTTPNTGAFTSLSTAPAANTSALTTTGYSLTGSNAQSLVDLAGTWNTTGTPSAIKLNITDTASNANSLLMQLQTGGTNQLTLTKAGLLTTDRIRVGNGSDAAPSYSFVNGTTSGFRLDSGVPRLMGYLNNTTIFVITSSAIAMQATHAFAWTSGGAGSTADTLLYRDAAGTLAQYNGTNAQEKRLYGTYTSSTNYQRMTIKSVKQTLSALSGASATTTGTFIPNGAVVVGVTTRVATALTGAAGYTIGDGTDADRWGDITGTAIGTTSDNRDWTAGTIECFTAGGEITLTAKTSNFTAGAIEICVFYLAGQAD